MEKSSAPKRFVISMNVLVQITLAGVLVVFLNIYSIYIPLKKLDLSQNGYFKISDKTETLLKSITSPLEVIVFFQPMSEDPVATRVFQDIQILLKEYQSVSKHLQVKYVDPDRDPINSEKLSNEYGVSVPNVVVFVQKKGENDRRFKFVKVDELVDFDRGANPFQQSNRIKAFKGEQMFTSAIQNVLEAKQSKVFFLEGHGEGDPDSPDRGKGFSSIGAYIRRDNLLVEKLNLLEKHTVPKDCDILVICNPTRAIGDEEFKAIREYLAQNGRLMVMLDAMNSDSGLERFLSEYGVKVGDNVVLTKIQDQLGGQALVTTAPGFEYTQHPVTDSLRKDRVATLFPMARSVDKIQEGGKEQITVLVKSIIPDTWAESNLLDLQKEKASYDEKDIAGPVPLVVAVEPNSAGDMEREGMRMIVFGSSGFVQNGSLKGGNVDLFMNATNWLLKRQQLIGIAAKTPQEFSLVMDPMQRQGVFFVVVIAIPASVGFIGFLVWLRRRR